MRLFLAVRFAPACWPSVGDQEGLGKSKKSNVRQLPSTYRISPAELSDQAIEVHRNQAVMPTTRKLTRDPPNFLFLSFVHSQIKRVILCR